jgi:hypothetical protein
MEYGGNLVETTTHTISRGDRLPNGAIVIDVKQAYEPYARIVLCLWTEDWQGEVVRSRNSDPYVTWVALIQDSGHISTQSGHYHDQLSEAVVDFNSRF